MYGHFPEAQVPNGDVFRRSCRYLHWSVCMCSSLCACKRILNLFACLHTWGFSLEAEGTKIEIPDYAWKYEHTRRNMQNSTRVCLCDWMNVHVVEAVRTGVTMSRDLWTCKHEGEHAHFVTCISVDMCARRWSCREANEHAWTHVDMCASVKTCDKAHIWSDA